MNYFLSKGVDVNQADKNGNTPFLNAAYLNNLEVVTLLSENANLKHKNKDGKSALTNAVQRNKSEIVNFILQKGAQINVLDKDGNNLTYYLIKSYNSRNKEEFLKKQELLAKAGFNIKNVQKDGNSLYHLAVDKKNMDLLSWVSNVGIDINLKNKEGLTALHKAVMSAKSTEMIQFLIKNGADKNIKTSFDETVYDLASENELLRKNKVDISFLK